MSRKLQHHSSKTLKLSLHSERLAQAALILSGLFRRKGNKMDRRTESDGQQTNVRKKGRTQKQLWEKDVQSSRQKAEGKSEGGAAQPLDQPTLPPVVSVQTLTGLMPSVSFSINEIVCEIKITSSLSPSWKVF